MKLSIALMIPGNAVAFSARLDPYYPREAPLKAKMGSMSSERPQAACVSHLDRHLLHAILADLTCSVRVLGACVTGLDRCCRHEVKEAAPMAAETERGN